MSINPCGPTNTVNTGCGNDNVHISKAEGLLGLMGYYKVEINGQTQYMNEKQLENTQFNLGGGNDTLVVDSNVKADIHANGGTGNDVMVGGAGNDDLHGGRATTRSSGAAATTTSTADAATTTCRAATATTTSMAGVATTSSAPATATTRCTPVAATTTSTAATGTTTSMVGAATTTWTAGVATTTSRVARVGTRCTVAPASTGRTTPDSSGSGRAMRPLDGPAGASCPGHRLFTFDPKAKTAFEINRSELANPCRSSWLMPRPCRRGTSTTHRPPARRSRPICVPN